MEVVTSFPQPFATPEVTPVRLSDSRQLASATLLPCQESMSFISRRELTGYLPIILRAEHKGKENLTF